MGFDFPGGRDTRERAEHQEAWVEPFPVDVSDHGDEFVVAAALPGLESDAIRVALLRERLHIEADFTGLGDDGQVVHAERNRGICSRSVYLPAPVDSAGARAAYRDGVLFVTLRKRASMRGPNRS